MSAIGNKKIDNYIDDVCSRVKNKKVHKLIKVELLCHFDDIIEDCLDKGMSKDDAIKQAILQMGSSEVIGDDLNKAHKTNSDLLLLVITAILVFFGMFTLGFVQKNSPMNSLEYYPNLLGKSFVYLIISIAISLLFVKLDYRKLKKYSKFIYAFSILLMILTTFISSPVNGVIGYIQIGNFSFNLLTINTLLLVVALSGIFDNYNWNSKKHCFIGILLLIAPSLIFIITPSLSNATIYLLSAFTIMIICGFKIRYLILTISSLLAIFSAFLLSEAYRIERFFAFSNPSKDPSGAGWIYNQLSSLNLSAGILGQGNNLTSITLPEAHTDFVFTSIIYSFGWIAGIILLAVILGFIIRIGFIGANTKDSYGKLLVSGICSLFAVQFLLSILANLSLSPILSVNMPFISYGGSQLLINILSIAIINNVYKQRNTPLISTF